MPLLNAGCGSCRPPVPWYNLDQLKCQFPIGSPERAQLDAEENFIEHTIGHGKLPFQDDSFDGCLLSHIAEHMNCQDVVAMIQDCRRILKPGGVLLVSVPDASYFRQVHAEDSRDNAERLFGEPIHDPSKVTFRSYALFFNQHVQLFTEDSLWCTLVEAGFLQENICRVREDDYGILPGEVTTQIMEIVNRRKFSLIMGGVK